jgi:hypothetical protein
MLTETEVMAFDFGGDTAAPVVAAPVAEPVAPAPVVAAPVATGSCCT